MKAIAESTGREMKKIKADYAEIGDLGIIAMVSEILPDRTVELSHYQGISSFTHLLSCHCIE